MKFHVVGHRSAIFFIKISSKEVALLSVGRMFPRAYIKFLSGVY